MAKKKLLIISVILSLIFSTFPQTIFAAESAVTLTPNWERLSGADRYETAAEISRKGWNASEYAVLAAGMDQNLVDALTAAPLAKAKNAPILLTGGDMLNSAAKNEMERLGVKTVYITSGSAVMKQPLKDELSAMGINIIALGGNDRFATSVNIAKELAKSVSVKTSVITTAYSNADALGVAPVAAAKGWPILLTGVTTLPECIKNYQESQGFTKTYIIGGTSAVHDSVIKQLPEPVRIGGANRYATNIKILETFNGEFDYSQGIYLANGLNNHLVDSLAASSLVAGSPLVLTGNQPADVTLDHLKANPETAKITIVGGTGSIDSTVQATITELLTLDQYTQNGAVLGADSASARQTFSTSIILNGNNTTLQNAIITKNVYIKGNNCTVSNVNIEGSLYIDPGEAGEAAIDKVTAKEIIVQSGASNSIHLTATSADYLTVAAGEDSQVRIVAGSATNIGNVTVQSYAVFDNQGGQIGIVTITSTPGQTPKVTLSGTFTEPVVVEGQADLSAAAGTVIPEVQINTPAAAQVNLNGNFSSVDVASETNVNLGAGTQVQNMSTKAAADIVVPPTASIGTYDGGTSGANVYGGGDVNGAATPETPQDSTSPADTSDNSGSSDNGGSSPPPTRSLNYGTGTFVEVAGNNGAIDQPLVITLSNDTFTGANNDDFIAGGKATVTNAPAGITPEVRRKSDTTVWLVLTGNANNHEDVNDIANLTISFQNSAFTGGNAVSVTNYTKNDLQIDFNNAAAAASDLIDTVTATSVNAAGDTIVVHYTEDLNETRAENKDNWTIKYADDNLGANSVAITTANATFDYSAADDQLTVTLDEATDQAVIPHNKYISVVPANTNVQNAGGSKYVDNTSVKYSVAVGKEMTGPSIATAWNKTSNKTFTITYDEVLNRTGATNTANWHFSDANNSGTIISGVTLSADGKTVTVTLSQAIEGYDQIFGPEPIVADLAGNPADGSNYEENGIMLSPNEVWVPGPISGFSAEGAVNIQNNYSVSYNDVAGGTNYFAGVNIKTARGSDYTHAIMQSKSVADVGNTSNDALKVFFTEISGNVDNLSGFVATPCKDDILHLENPVNTLYLAGQRNSGALVNTVIKLFVRDTVNDVETFTYLTIKGSVDYDTGIDIIANPHLETGNQITSIQGAYSYTGFGGCTVNLDVFDDQGSQIASPQLEGRIRIRPNGSADPVIDSSNYTIDEANDTITFTQDYLLTLANYNTLKTNEDYNGFTQQFFIEYYQSAEDYTNNNAYAAGLVALY